MPISAKELAHKLGVSPSSISIALNGKPGISDKTRSRILEAAEEHGLKRNQSVRSVQTVSSTIHLVIYRKHGLIFNDGAFFSEVLESLNASAASFGYTVNISYLYETDNLNEQIRELHSCDSAGFILLATEMHECDMQHFADFTKPIVVLDSSFSSYSYNYVVINNVEGAFNAVHHLIENGHKRILHITTDIAPPNLNERRQGAYMALSEYPDCEIETVTVRSAPEDSYIDLSKYISDKSSDPDSFPTAVFAGSDMLAASCMRALAEKGYRIPDDVSVIGFDDIPICTMVSPMLSTVHVDKSKLGMYAVRRLLDLLNGDDGHIKLQIGTSLCLRDSVRHI